jgi:hypothetical protein
MTTNVSIHTYTIIDTILKYDPWKIQGLEMGISEDPRRLPQLLPQKTLSALGTSYWAAEAWYWI